MSDDTSPLRIEVLAEKRIAVVTLDRPPVNAIDAATQTAIRDTFDDLGARQDINVIVLTGAGRRAFCAGVDLRSRGAQAAQRPLDGGKPWRQAKEAVFRCNLPVIGAINGAAIGGGLGLTSVCDILIAADHAEFGLTEINVGLLGGGSAAMRLVGPYKMRRMFFTGELVSAQEMYRLGAVEEVVPYDQLMPTALALAERIAVKSPIGLRLAKESIVRMEEFVSPWSDAYRMEQDYTNRLSAFDDSREGIQSFIEKRDPRWSWR